MRFTPLPLAGAYVLDLEPVEDARGFNARAYCEREFAEHDLQYPMVQTNVILNRRAGTLRGFHWQTPPNPEAKLFRCTRGSLHDVVIDLRPESPTFEQWTSVVLTAASRRELYVPPSFGQAFLTLEDDTEVQYQTSEFHTPRAERGIRWDDPYFAVEWPREVVVLSDKDAAWPDYRSGS